MNKNSLETFVGNLYLLWVKSGIQKSHPTYGYHKKKKVKPLKLIFLLYKLYRAPVLN